MVVKTFLYLFTAVSILGCSACFAQSLNYGKVEWTYSIPGREEYGDCTRLSNGNIVFSRRFSASEVTPDKKIVWNYEAPPKTEDKPVETKVEPPAQPQAEVTLPRAEEQKEIEKPKQEATPPAPETRAMPKGERLGQFSEAASNAYLARVAGHLKRFIRYPMEAHGASGTVLVRFELNRDGEVIGSEVRKSSGNSILDRTALAILQRASPFPTFPAAKPEARDSYLVPVEFYR